MFDVILPTKASAIPGEKIYLFDEPPLRNFCFDVDLAMANLRVQYRHALSLSVVERSLKELIAKYRLTFKRLQNKGDSDCIYQVFYHDGIWGHQLDVQVKRITTYGGVCLACGRNKKTVSNQTILSHSVVAASAWSEIVARALRSLRVDLKSFDANEKQVLRELVNIGENAREGFPGADTAAASQCKECEELHANFSLLQRYQKYMASNPIARKPELIGLQFLQVGIAPAMLRTDFELRTRAVLKRVTAVMEFELMENFPGRFMPKPPPVVPPQPLNPLIPVPPPPPLKHGAPRRPKKPKLTVLPDILEFILLDIDTFMAAVRRYGYEVCNEVIPVTRHKW